MTFFLDNGRIRPKSIAKIKSTMTQSKTLKIATRQSPLAIWQANFVKDRLEQLHSRLTVELVPMVTKGDVILDSPLA